MSEVINDEERIYTLDDFFKDYYREENKEPVRIEPKYEYNAVLTIKKGRKNVYKLNMTVGADNIESAQVMIGTALLNRDNNANSSLLFEQILGGKK